MVANPPALEDAIAQHRLGHVDAAAVVYQTLTTTHPDLAEPWHLLGVVQIQKGNPGGAEPFFCEALRRDDAHVKCHTNLAAALYLLGRPGEAEIELRTALRLDPHYEDALYNLGNVLVALSRPDEALASYLATLKVNPAHVKALINAGELYQRAHKYVDARPLLQKAVALAPDDFTGLLNLAIVLENLNDVSGARTAIAGALRQHPDDTRANLIAALICLRDGEPDQALACLEITLRHALDTPTEVNALFARAQAYEDLQQSDNAFAAYVQANATEWKRLLESGIHPEKYRQRLDIAHKRLDAGPVTPGTAGPAPEEPHAPVFFVGFPRSGTTLFEQMLSSHPSVVTTNEISPLHKVLHTVDMTQPADAIDEKTQTVLRAQFWHEAHAIVGDIGDRVFVDTAPLNISALDIAGRLFPEAKVLMVLRDPRDACLSCFMQSFQSNEQLANFLTLDTTAQVYDKVMGLWLRQKNRVALPRMEFRYEDLVVDMEGQTRAVLDFLGLEWVDDIRTYRDRAREGHIITPSYRQVGEKLHTRACQRWRRYQHHIEPLIKTLSPYIEAFGYDD